ncbi:hypothetical protein [Aquiflexum sp.]|uniref:hypothetical protein n=1 Tax=Aquiflexum sp. TaxID=1872584 RepID=UPI003593B4C6
MQTTPSHRRKLNLHPEGAVKDWAIRLTFQNSEESMLNRNIKYIWIFITAVILTSCNYCKIAEMIAKREVIGIVDSKKKLEWNRGEQTIMYKEENQIKSYEILRDESGLWDFVEKGDSLYKPLNDKRMKVYRNGDLAGEFLMDIGCLKHLRNEK